MKAEELSRLEYGILVDSIKHRPAMKWCEQQFGIRWGATDCRTGQWTVFWAGRNSPDKYQFWFANKEDMMMFTLRWS